MEEKYDFSGYCTRADVLCADGRVIKKHAFKECDGKVVPLIWNHDHTTPFNVIGHALLEDREDGVFTYGKFNGSAEGIHAKELVRNGDIESMSIYANRLTQNGSDVVHGMIREVSLVYAGANPGAYIENVMIHGEESDDEAIIYSGDTLTSFRIEHAENEEPEKDTSKTEEVINDKETVKDIIDTFTDKQKNVLYGLIGEVASEYENKDNDEGDDNMKHNLFDNDESTKENIISHSEMKAVIDDCNRKRYGSMKDACLAHGITNVEYLFPDFKNVNDVPDFVKRDTGWVADVMGKVHHTPFSRIKSIYADITADEARAKGYVKGKQKVEETITLLKRTTDPQTVYKKQKMDRDDVVDITDFDVIAWLKTEMRMMLDEELARAFLIGDGRSSASDDKIKPDHIRPIWTDDDLYTIKAKIEVEDHEAEITPELAKKFIVNAIKSRSQYKGSGNPTLYTSESMLAAMLLLEDVNGRFIYESESQLARTLRVTKIVTVPVMEGAVREADSTHDGAAILGLIVNLADYNVGADKGGAVNMFDDFDIDYNRQKYLIETRCSGALIKPHSAIAIEAAKTKGGV